MIVKELKIRMDRSDFKSIKNSYTTGFTENRFVKTFLNAIFVIPYNGLFGLIKRFKTHGGTCF
jgi:hypothetical protein